MAEPLKPRIKKGCWFRVVPNSEVLFASSFEMTTTNLYCTMTSVTAITKVIYTQVHIVKVFSYSKNY